MDPVTVLGLAKSPAAGARVILDRVCAALGDWSGSDKVGLVGTDDLAFTPTP
jgi:pantothenate kinase